MEQLTFSLEGLPVRDSRLPENKAAEYKAWAVLDDSDTTDVEKLETIDARIRVEE
jgi:hypothetical protein